MTKEIWRDIPGYEGLYQASTLGRIRSLDMVKDFYSIERKPYIQMRKGKVLNPYRGAKNYMTVILYKDKYYKTLLVHRLIAITFLENPNNYEFIEFKDGDKHNTKLDNLEWISRSSAFKKAYLKRKSK